MAVELYADAPGADAPPLRQPMTCIRQLVGAPGGYLYGATVAADRPAEAFTARLLPYRTGVAIPLECPHILWQR